MAFLKFLLAVFSIIILPASCGVQTFQSYTSQSVGAIKENISKLSLGDNEEPSSIRPLVSLLDSSAAAVELNGNFLQIMKTAVMFDPAIVAAKENYLAQETAVKVSHTAKKFQVSGSVYGGIEDVSEKSSGIALVLTANRLVYDGGALESRIASEIWDAEASRYGLISRVDRRAVELAGFWVDLERYQTLKDKIDSRLKILGPLFDQLEKVAEAGLGDVTKVSAAQRTVAAVKVTQTDISNKLQQAQINFENAFGSLPGDTRFDISFVEGLMPTSISEDIRISAPVIQADYAFYKSAEANLSYVEAKYNFNVGFEGSVTRPFGGSSSDSDESIGLVARKTLYNGNKASLEIKHANTRVKSSIAKLQASYRDGSRRVQNSLKTIVTLTEAMNIAEKNAVITQSEVNNLRQQLIIGESTLDSVLSGEARLYEAEAKEINFRADKIKLQVEVLGALGLLSNKFDITF